MATSPTLLLGEVRDPIDLQGRKYLHILNEGKVTDLLGDFSKRRDNIPIMRKIKHVINSEFNYSLQWAARGLARENNCENPTLAFLPFPIMDEKNSETLPLILGLVYGFFEVVNQK